MAQKVKIRINWVDERDQQSHSNARLSACWFSLHFKSWVNNMYICTGKELSWQRWKASKSMLTAFN